MNMDSPWTPAFDMYVLYADLDGGQEQDLRMLIAFEATRPLVCSGGQQRERR
jgi:hypothetical protein